MPISRTTLWAALLASSVGCGGATATAGGTTTANGPRALEVRIEEVDAETLDALVQDEARLVAEDVAARRAARHESLPAVERSDATNEPDAWPLVTVRNNTPNGLVVWFAGPCARAVALAAQATQSVELCEGRYDIAAQLASPDFAPFVGNGDEVANGSRYSLTFYVLVQPQTLRRVRRR